RMRAITIVVSLCGAFALSGLAIGLGALMPNLKEDNPARIVTGFGGTLDLLLGFAYVLVTSVLVAIPAALAAGGRLQRADEPLAEAWALVGIVVLSLATGLIPLVLGERHFERLEP